MPTVSGSAHVTVVSRETLGRWPPPPRVARVTRVHHGPPWSGHGRPARGASRAATLPYSILVAKLLYIELFVEGYAGTVGTPGVWSRGPPQQETTSENPAEWKLASISDARKTWVLRKSCGMEIGKHI